MVGMVAEKGWAVEIRRSQHRGRKVRRRQRRSPASPRTWRHRPQSSSAPLPRPAPRSTHALSRPGTIDIICASSRGLGSWPCGPAGPRAGERAVRQLGRLRAWSQLAARGGVPGACSGAVTCVRPTGSQQPWHTRTPQPAPAPCTHLLGQVGRRRHAVGKALHKLPRHLRCVTWRGRAGARQGAEQQRQCAAAAPTEPGRRPLQHPPGHALAPPPAAPAAHSPAGTPPGRAPAPRLAEAERKNERLEEDGWRQAAGGGRAAAAGVRAKRRARCPEIRVSVGRRRAGRPPAGEQAFGLMATHPPSPRYRRSCWPRSRPCAAAAEPSAGSNSPLYTCRRSRPSLLLAGSLPGGGRALDGW